MAFRNDLYTEYMESYTYKELCDIKKDMELHGETNSPKYMPCTEAISMKYEMIHG